MPCGSARHGKGRLLAGLSLETVVQGLRGNRSLLYLAALMLVLDLVVVAAALAFFDRERLLPASA